MPNNFYDLLKYAKTGISAPSMSNLDKIRALSLAGGYPLSTITGVPPLTFRADGRPLTAWSIYGNGRQTGTPSPDNIIMPDFCGKKDGTDWTIPIICAGQTVPVYLGQTQTVRRIKKLVLTGDENWTVSPDDYQASCNLTGKALSRIVVCSHYKGQVLAQNGYAWISAELTSLFIADAVNCTDKNTLKAYLQQQYAAGTPVTVWYVLATPKTAIVNEPLAKIGNYADELHSEDAGVTIPTTRGQNVLTVGTDLQPSSVSITGHIKLT